MKRRLLMNRPMYDADGGGAGTGGAGAGSGGTSGGDGAGGAGDPASGSDTATAGADGAKPAAGNGGDAANADPPAGVFDLEKFMAGVDERIQKAAEETAKKAAMSDVEKAEYDRAKKAEELDTREKALAARELRADTAALLAEKKLPAEILDVVLGADKAATEKNIAAFVKTFDAAVQKQVETRLAGKTPPAGNAEVSGAATLADALAEHYRK